MEEGISRRRFIRLGAAIGVTATGATMVAACGSGESGGNGGGDSVSSGGGGETSAGGSGGSTDSTALPALEALPGP